jgi:hypothetical protein
MKYLWLVKQTSQSRVLLLAATSVDVLRCVVKSRAFGRYDLDDEDDVRIEVIRENTVLNMVNLN